MSKSALSLAQQRIKAERLVAQAYASLDMPPHEVMSPGTAPAAARGSAACAATATSAATSSLYSHEAAAREATTLEAAFGREGGVAMPHSRLMEVLSAEVEAPLVSSIESTEATLGASTEIAASLTRELKAHTRRAYAQPRRAAQEAP